MGLQHADGLGVVWTVRWAPLLYTAMDTVRLCMRVLNMVLKKSRRAPIAAVCVCRGRGGERCDVNNRTNRIMCMCVPCDNSLSLI